MEEGRNMYGCQEVVGSCIMLHYNILHYIIALNSTPQCSEPTLNELDGAKGPSLPGHCKALVCKQHWSLKHRSCHFHVSHV